MKPCTQPGRPKVRFTRINIGRNAPKNFCILCKKAGLGGMAANGGGAGHLMCMRAGVRARFVININKSPFPFGLYNTGVTEI